VGSKNFGFFTMLATFKPYLHLNQKLSISTNPVLANFKTPQHHFDGNEQARNAHEEDNGKPILAMQCLKQTAHLQTAVV
jgi:hypothetical protein